MQSFHEEELLKIKKAISGFFRKSARTAVSETLLDTKVLIDEVQLIDLSKRRASLDALLQEATRLRQRAVASGANSYSNPEWAAAAAAESWLLTLTQHEDGQVDNATRSRTEKLIYQLMG